MNFLGSKLLILVGLYVLSEFWSIFSEKQKLFLKTGVSFLR